MMIVIVVNIITIFVYLATSCEVTHSHTGLRLENIVIYVFPIPFTFI